uniref:Not1 n=1 Tax=Ciona intestinalis TaxID=7719 RepID=Q9NDQ7_CIOIN|nr:Not1 protein precursor [Ciona intestinalis]BAB00619.1 Not1 [Ciona intestinalis]|eukprot:NP_001027601.1 Not1 protein precursor [Ciona intestinalis]
MKLFTILCLSVTSLYAVQGFICRDGFELTSAGIHNMENKNDCGACLRMEASAFMYGFLATNLTMQSCAHQYNCSQVDCRTAATLFTGGGGRQSVITNVTCNVVCCYQDGCNENTISEILSNPEILQAPTTTTTTTEKPTTTVQAGEVPVPEPGPGYDLYCATGYTLTSALMNRDIWNVTKCTGNQAKCIRAKADVLAAGIFEANVTAGMCVTQQQCKNTTCDNLAQLFILANPTIQAQLFGIQFVVRTCDMACCAANECNENEISVIKSDPALQIPPTNTTAPTGESPTPGMATQLSCLEGYNLTSSVANFADWNIKACTGQNTMCMRANAKVKAQGRIEANVTTGMCVTQQQCNNLSCDALADMFVNATAQVQNQFRGMTFDVTSCSHFCCNENNCNRYATKLIETMAYTTAEPVNKPRSSATTNRGRFFTVLSLAFVFSSVILI